MPRKRPPRDPDQSAAPSWREALPAGLEEAVHRYLREEGRRWLEDPNIVGLSLDEKSSGGAGTGIAALRFDVIGKLPHSADIIRAGSRPIPAVVEIGGHTLATDIVEGWPEAHALAPLQPKSRHDPVGGGISVGTRTDTGTLGGILWHAPSGQRVGLSNWHVLANDQANNAVFQPGPGDAGGQLSALGVLRGEKLDIDVDAAVTTIQGRGIRDEIAELGVEIAEAVEPEPNMRVVKSGKETGVTFGIVTNPQKLVSYRIFGRPQRHSIMVCVIEADPSRPPPSSLSKGGDSGSCWMKVGNDGRPTGKMVALHVGGDSSNRLAYGCRASMVFSRLGLEPVRGRGLVPAPPPPPPPGAMEESPQLHKVIARAGLLIRSGPGREFPAEAGLPFGAEVSVLSRQGDWSMVDLQGDGRADGFMHSAFLRGIYPD